MDNYSFNQLYRQNTENGSAVPNTSINQEFWAYILELINEDVEEFDIEDRKNVVTMLTEDYYKRTGDTMPERMLSCLADYLLMETLKDKNVDKVTEGSYPILSHRQLKRRYNREFSAVSDHLEYFSAKDRYQFAEKKRTNDADSTTMDYAYKYQKI